MKIINLGKSCEENAKFILAKKCRYCTQVIKVQGPVDDICKSPECLALYDSSCKKKLSCGHQCYGCKDEKNCLHCLNSSCKNYVNCFGLDEDAYCAICYTESLSCAPVIKLSCNHIFHLKCVLTKLENRWLSPKINFNHDNCESCKQWMSAPNNPDIQNLLNKDAELFELVKKKTLERMKFDGIDKDPRLSNKSDPYYSKPLEYGLHKCAYYMCYKCKKPYFAGLRDCAGGPADNQQNQNNANKSFDPTHLICGGCSDLSGVAGVTDCKKHGKVLHIFLIL